MKVEVDFEITYEILFKQNELWSKGERKNHYKDKFKKRVIKDEVKLGKAIGHNRIVLDDITHTNYSSRDCKILASCICSFRDELPYNCSKLANLFVKEFLGIGDNCED